jgi:hypothetical protein
VFIGLADLEVLEIEAAPLVPQRRVRLHRMLPDPGVLKSAADVANTDLKTTSNF